MKFGLKYVAALAAAAFVVRMYLDYKEKQSAPKTSKIGQVHQDDPLATLDDQSGPLDGQSTDPITEAAYHQGVAEHSPSMGADENTYGEEVITIL